MSDLFTLRPARDSDKPYLDAYCSIEGMDTFPDVEGVTVAANADDEPVGFIRIACDAAGVAHVYPIVTYELWRGHGVGRALMEDARARFGELRLVSRGSSKPFYEALGLEDCDWSLIGDGLSEDCLHCEMREDCGPQPMRWLP